MVSWSEMKTGPSYRKEECKTIICSLTEECIGKVAIGVYIHVGSAEPDIHASDNLTKNYPEHTSSYESNSTRQLSESS